MQKFNCKKCWQWVAWKVFKYRDEDEPEHVPLHYKLVGYHDMDRKKNIDKAILYYEGDVSHLFTDIKRPVKTVVEEELLADLVDFIPKSVTNVIKLRQIGIVPGL
jgi:hypothetical protein